LTAAIPIIAVIAATEKLAVAEKHKTALPWPRELQVLDPHILEVRVRVRVPRDANSHNLAQVSLFTDGKDEAQRSTRIVSDGNHFSGGEVPDRQV
jgi:hypothetical protein